MNGYDFLCEYYETMDRHLLYPMSYSFADVCLYPISFCILTDDQLRAIFSYFAWEQRNAMLSGDLIWAEKTGEKIAQILEMVLSEGAGKFVLPLDSYTVDKYGHELNYLDLIFANKEHPVIKSNIIQVLAQARHTVIQTIINAIERANARKIMTFKDGCTDYLLKYTNNDSDLIETEDEYNILITSSEKTSLGFFEKLKRVNMLKFEAGIKLKDIFTFDTIFAHRLDIYGIIFKLSQHGYRPMLEGMPFEFKEFIPLKLVEMLVQHRAEKDITEAILSKFIQVKHNSFGAIKSEFVQGFRMTYGNVIMEALVNLRKEDTIVQLFEDMSKLLAEVNTPQIYLSEFVQIKGPENQIQLSKGQFPAWIQHHGLILDNLVIPIIDNKTLVISEMPVVEYIKKQIDIVTLITVENLIRKIFLQEALVTVDVDEKTIAELESLLVVQSPETIVNILHDGRSIAEKNAPKIQISEVIVQLHSAITEALVPENIFGVEFEQVYAHVLDSIEHALETTTHKATVDEYTELVERVQYEINKFKDMTVISYKDGHEVYSNDEHLGFQKYAKSNVSYTPDVTWYYKVGTKEALIQDKQEFLNNVHKEAMNPGNNTLAYRYLGRDVAIGEHPKIVFKYGTKLFWNLENREVFVDGKFEKEISLTNDSVPLTEKLAQNGTITSSHVLIERDSRSVMLDNLFILLSQDFIEATVSKEPGWMEQGYIDLYGGDWSRSNLAEKTGHEATIPLADYYGYTRDATFEATGSFMTWADAKLEKNIYIMPDSPLLERDTLKEALITSPPKWYDEKVPLLAYIEYSGFIRTMRCEIDVILESRNILVDSKFEKEFTDGGHFILVDRALLRELNTEEVYWYEKESKEIKEAVDSQGPGWYEKAEKFFITYYSRVGWYHRLMKTVLVDTARGVFDRIMRWYQKFLPWMYISRAAKPTTFKYVHHIRVDKEYRPATSISYHVLMESIGRNIILPDAEKWFEKLGRNSYIEELVVTITKDPRGIYVADLVIIGDREMTKVNLYEFDGFWEHPERSFTQPGDVKFIDPVERIVNLIEEQLQIVKDREIILTGQIEYWEKTKNIKIFEKLLLDKVERAIIELLGPEYVIKDKMIYLAENFCLTDKSGKQYTPLIGYSLLEMYQRWHFMPSDGPWDKMILPTDYPYATLPIMGISEHPIPWGGDKAIKEIKVSILIMANVLDFCRELWYANLRLYTRFTPSQAIKHFVKNIYDWLTKYTPETGWKPPEFYFEDYGYYNTNKIVLEDYWRLYRWIRWYAEGIIMNVPVCDKNDINMGNTYVRRLIDDLIKYFNDHHGSYGLPSQKNINKHKGQRHLFIKGDESYGNEF